MGALLSKLTMCVCAAGTGAALVPTAHAVKRHFKPHNRPAVHRTVARVAPAAPMFASAVDCPPAATLAGTGGAAGLAGTPLVEPVAAGAPGLTPTAFTPLGGYGGDDLTGASFGGGGFAGGGGGGSGGGGGVGSGPGLPPTASNAPEPASWAMMVAGFGVLGGAMRYGRAASVGKGEIVEVKLG